ncbi:MAG: alpha/beta hydrolase [Bacteroidota bacterium]
MQQFNSSIYNQWYTNQGKGKTVLLLHGLFGDLRMWNSTIDALKDNYHVIVPRLPLFDLPANNKNVAFLVDVLHEFIIWHKLDKVIIIGHGIGSQLALLYSYHHPEVVDRVVVSGSTSQVFEPYFNSHEPREIDFELVEERLHTAFYQPELVSETLVNRVLSNVRKVSNLVSVDEVIQPGYKNQVSFLKEIDRPVLLLWGLEDKITPAELAMDFHAELQHSVVHFIGRCGHVPMFEQPEAYNWHVTHFLDA